MAAPGEVGNRIHKQRGLQQPGSRDRVVETVDARAEIYGHGIVNLFGGEAPRLRNVKLIGAPVVWASSVLAGLETLDIQGITAHGSPTTKELLGVVSSSPMLTTLHIRDVEFLLDEDLMVVPLAPPKRLTRLVSLRIGSLLCVVAAVIIGSLCAPSCRDFSLELEVEGLRSPQTSLLDQCGTSLRTIITHILQIREVKRVELVVNLTSFSMESDSDNLRWSFTGLHDGFSYFQRVIGVLGTDCLATVPTSLTVSDFNSRADLTDGCRLKPRKKPADSDPPSKSETPDTRDPLHMYNWDNGLIQTLDRIPEQMAAWEPYLPSVRSIVLKGAYAEDDWMYGRWDIAPFVDFLRKVIPPLMPMGN